MLRRCTDNWILGDGTRSTIWNEMSRRWCAWRMWMLWSGRLFVTSNITLYSDLLFFLLTVRSGSFCGSHGEFLHRFRSKILFIWLSHVRLCLAEFRGSYSWVMSGWNVFNIFSGDVFVQFFLRFAFSMSCFNLSLCFLRLRFFHVI